MVALVQITKEDVDTFEVGHEIPSCQLTAVWTKQGDPSHLRQKVTLIGANKPNNYFNIVLDSTKPDTTGGELLEKKLSLLHLEKVMAISSALMHSAKCMFVLGCSAQL